MKTIIILCTFFICFCTSCKKDAEQPAFKSYLRFKMDGTQIECSENIRVHFSGYYSLMSAMTIDGGKQDVSLELQLFEDVDISNGQYVFDADHHRRGTLWINHTAYAAGDEGFYNTLSGSGEITITEISKQFVKGTFHFKSGTDYTSNPSKDITDGEFYIEVK